MTIRKHLFLDLEDTIITPVTEGWWCTELINVQKIKDVIAEFQPDVINIFSFAIWNDMELESFNKGTRPMIEQALGRTLSAVPRVEGEIIEACCNEMWLARERVDFIDLNHFWGKHEAFRLNMRHLFKNAWDKWQQETVVMLLDDAVMNENFEWPDLHIKGMIKDITKL